MTPPCRRRWSSSPAARTWSRSTTPRPFAAKVNDGGFYYTVAAGGQSMAGPTPDGGLRSYGSMTYAGFKSMIYAGVEPDDPRVKAAYEWIQKHYTLDENPGMGAAACTTTTTPSPRRSPPSATSTIVDADGKSHDWRRRARRANTSPRKTPTAAGSTKPRAGSKAIPIS